jgi:hypothetical protein
VWRGINKSGPLQNYHKIAGRVHAPEAATNAMRCGMIAAARQKSPPIIFFSLCVRTTAAWLYQLSLIWSVLGLVRF